MDKRDGPYGKGVTREGVSRNQLREQRKYRREYIYSIRVTLDGTGRINFEIGGGSNDD